MRANEMVIPHLTTIPQVFFVRFSEGSVRRLRRSLFPGLATRLARCKRPRVLESCGCGGGYYMHTYLFVSQELQVRHLGSDYASQ